MIELILMAVGFIEIRSNPRAKKLVNIIPITVSSLRRVLFFKAKILKEAIIPLEKAPKKYGREKKYDMAIPGTRL